MLNLGAIKLRRWRLHSLGTCSDTGRRCTVTQQETGARVGVGRMMISLLESGERQPSLAVATRLQALGVCAPEDWTRKATCIPCGIALGLNAPDCDNAECEWREAAGRAEAVTA